MKKIIALSLFIYTSLLQAAPGQRSVPQAYKSTKKEQATRAFNLGRTTFVQSMSSSSDDIAGDLKAYVKVFGRKFVTEPFQGASMLQIAEQKRDAQAVHAILDCLTRSR